MCHDAKRHREYSLPTMNEIRRASLREKRRKAWKNFERCPSRVAILQNANERGTARSKSLVSRFSLENPPLSAVITTVQRNCHRFCDNRARLQCDLCFLIRCNDQKCCVLVRIIEKQNRKIEAPFKSLPTIA